MSESLHELVAVFCTAESLSNDECDLGVAAVAHGLGSEVDEHAFVCRCRITHSIESEILEVVGLEDELRKRPFLQLVLVSEQFNGQLVEALLRVNGAPEDVNH